MSARENRQWKLRARPAGVATREHFDFVTSPVPSPAAGELLVEVEYVSLDPAMRGWLNDAKSYVPPVGIGEVMRAIGVGKVIESQDPGFAAGDFVTGMTGVQAFATAPAKAWTKIDPSLVPLPRWLGIVGMPGMTAYFGLLDVGGPVKAGETLVVSAASGAVGAVVGQIGKLHGMRVVGIAGGGDKCRYIVDELGFDAAIDYKHDDVRKKLREACPQGIDVYFDNVGGDHLQAAIEAMRLRGRIAVCGMIAQYNAERPVPGPTNLIQIVGKRLTIRGFIVTDWMNQTPEFLAEVAPLVRSGRIKTKETVVEGIDHAVDAFIDLLRGGNIGKMVVKI